MARVMGPTYVISHDVQISGGRIFSLDLARRNTNDCESHVRKRKNTSVARAAVVE